MKILILTRKNIYTIDIKKFFSSLLKLFIILFVIWDFSISVLSSPTFKTESTKEIILVDYIVKKNDSLYKIANDLNYNEDIRITIEKIKKYNNLKTCDIYVNQVLKIPTKK